MLIRNIEKEHIPIVVDMFIDMNKYIESYLPEMMHMCQSKKIISKWILTEKEGIWKVLEIKKDIIGFFHYQLFDSVLILNNIFIQKEHRNKGYSKKIMDFLIIKAKKIEIEYIELESYLTPSLNIYKSLGFIPYSTTLYKSIKGC